MKHDSSIDNLIRCVTHVRGEIKQYYYNLKLFKATNLAKLSCLSHDVTLSLPSLFFFKKKLDMIRQ